MPGGWSPGDAVPNGYKIRYKYSEKKLLVGGSILAGSFIATSLIASGIAFTGIGAIYAPAATVPVIGAFPVAAVGAIAGVGPGTVAALVGLGLVQGVGFTILMNGVATRKPLGIVPQCEARNEGDRFVITPLVSPTMAGLSFGGAL